MATSIKPPTTEVGTELPFAAQMYGLPGWAAFVDLERSPDLVWPNSLVVYDNMRNDSQIEALLAAITLPIRRRRWAIDPNGARPEIVAGISSDLGLPVKGEDPKPKPRSRGRFSWDRHLMHALLALTYGHYFFELVGYIGDDGLWHLKKLAPRPPKSISRFTIDPTDGGLQGIVQWGAGADGRPPEIPVGRLVGYVWEQEAANWVGRSMLRSCFRDWTIKDRLIRVDAIKHERNGMGIPIGKVTDQNVGPQAVGDLQQMAAAARAGDVSSGVTPWGTDLEFKGVQGTLPDTLASIKARDEAMARRFLAMFVQLGQTETGSRALGTEFIDFFAMALDTVAGWVADTTNEHVIEDWVDFNYGPGEEQVPLLITERNEEPELTATDLVSLVGSGLLVVDDDVRDVIRARAGFSPTDHTPPPAAPPVQATARTDRRSRDRVAATATEEPAALAKTDFASLQQAYLDAVSKLKTAWATVRAAQIDELVAKVEAARSPADLAAITASVAGINDLMPALDTVIEHGAQSAITEAAAQGVTLAAPALGATKEAITAAAAGSAALLARDLANSAASKAVALHGPHVTPAEIGAQVRDHLEGLAGATVDYEFAGLVTKAQNAGRFTAMQGAPDGTRFYASELNDDNTCEACAEEDGSEFASLDEAMGDYPAGYVGCEGGNRCRGTAVAVYAEATPSA